MSQNLCAKKHKTRPTVLRFSLAGMFVLAAMAMFGNTGCEDKAIGRPCDVLTKATSEQGIYNSEALECPSRICLKPVVQKGATMPNPATTAYCSASCSQDSDCDGQTREVRKCPDNNPCPANGQCADGSTCTPDLRCSQGFACGIAFVKGSICCQKLCLCKDFLSPAGAPIPIACQGDNAATCNSAN
jgi:hypothetical protein